ncbi:Protein RMD5 A [Nymphon striatum]|nr:Protein RMD5 A [Nymphon striatum]
MECVIAVEKELGLVLQKFTGINEHAHQTLTALIEYVQSLRKELEEVPPTSEVQTSHSVILTDCIKKIRETVTCLANEHRDMHSTVSKVGKAIDRNFTSDYGAASVISFFNGFQHHDLLNTVICEHFYRNGMLEISEDLAKEAHLTIDAAKREPFYELNCILEALMKKDLGPALQWVEKKREYLQTQQSLLEFKLHRLQFIELIRQGPEKQHEVIVYARKSFQSLPSNHMNGYSILFPSSIFISCQKNLCTILLSLEALVKCIWILSRLEDNLQSLMGSLLFIPQGIENSPYSHLLDAANWTDICDLFTRDACSLLGLSVDSPLAVCINAGCAAFPALLNIKQAMLQRQVSSVWNSKDELPSNMVQTMQNSVKHIVHTSLEDVCAVKPDLHEYYQSSQFNPQKIVNVNPFNEHSDLCKIEVDLGKHSRYHSVFACPILRQPSTESNPPMRLGCGHVISKDALNKLANGNRLKERKMRFAGHVMRDSSGDLLNLILEGSIEGVWDRGRQRRTWGDDVKEWSRTTSIGDAKRTAESRENWRGIVANLRNGECTA